MFEGITPKTRYDVFICCSETDRDWASKDLVTELKNRGFLCCLEDRDRPPGMWPFADSFTEAVQHSRKTLIILTPDFVASEYYTFELNVALSLSLEKALSHQIVPIVYKKCTAPMELRGRSYLSWEDFPIKSHFWDALEEALRLPNDAGVIVSVHEIPLLRQPVELQKSKQLRGVTSTPSLEDIPGRSLWLVYSHKVAWDSNRWCSRNDQAGYFSDVKTLCHLF